MGVYLYPSGTETPLQDAYIGEVRPAQIYNADFSSSTGWTIQANGGNITITGGTVTVVSGWGGIYRDISNDLDFTNASKIEIEYTARPYLKPWSGGMGLVLGSQGLSGGNYHGSDGTIVWLQVATSQGTGAGIALAGTDVYNGTSASDLTTQTDTPVKAVIDLANESYEFYLYGTLKSSGSISSSLIADFYNVNNQYLCFCLSDYCKVSNLSIKVE